MPANETSFDLLLRAQADTSAAKAEYDRLFAQLKSDFSQALAGEGVSPQFIAQFNDGLDEIREKLDAAGSGDSLDKLNAEVEKLVANLQQAAEAERKRVETLRQNFQAALDEKDAQEEALALARRRREEDRLNLELEQLAAQRRMAAIREEAELRRAAELGRQMSAEQAIEREARARGAYDPGEEVDRLRELEAGAKKVGEANRGLGANAGAAALEVGRLFEDMQYGIAGALNNLPGLITMLGGSLGLAGVISIASVALVQLWKHFSGAAEAADNAEAAREGMERLKNTLEEASAASEKAFKNDLDKYVKSITEAADQWERNKQNIADALQYQNQLADAEQRAALARLEIERQSKLGGAATSQDREAINADFDLRRANISQTGQAAAMQRALESQALAQNTLRARIAESEAARSSAESVVAGSRDSIASTMDTPIGRLSDEAASLRRLDQLNAEIRGTQGQLQKATADAAAASGESGPMRWIADDRLKAVEDKLSGLYLERDRLEAARPANEQAVREGKVNFTEATKKAVEEGTPSMLEGIRDVNLALVRYRALIEESLPAIEKNKEETQALERELNEARKKEALLKAQQIALQEETKAAQAKAATDQLLRDEKADEEQRKKDAEAAKKKAADEALAKENQARKIEDKDPVAAAKLRNEAAKLQLPEDATQAMRDKADLDAQDRVRKAQERVQKDADKLTDETRDVGRDVAAFARRGPKGVGGGASLDTQQIERAAAVLEDGGTEKELRDVKTVLERFGAGVVQNQESLKAEARELRRRLEELASQVANGGRR